jgi:DNA repair protein RecN (Recombination protein N)
MLEELSVQNLGVIDRLTLPLGLGMTALTGETGAGKTLLVEAIELLVGGRAEAILVRPGADEARVDGRFVTEDGTEIIVSRVIPRGGGRSRAYLDGRPASVQELAELGAALVDLHGQHAHQSLLAPAAQRGALDRFAGVDLGPLRAAAATVKALEAELAGYGGDDAARARELEFCRFQLAEVEAADLSDPDEDAQLEAEEERLADAVAHQEAAATAYTALSADGGVGDGLATAVGLVRDRAPLASAEGRLRALAAEVADLAADLRDLAETLEPDPERLGWVRARRAQLRDLARKYGVAAPGTPVAGAVLDYSAQVRDRLAVLEQHVQRAASIEAELASARAKRDVAAAEVAKARRAAAPALSDATQAQLNSLAMPRARLGVDVGGPDPGDDVSFLLAANPGAPLLPLAKVASGGELARSMLALRLALLRAGDPAAGLPPTMIFDEVDAGIGGTAASAVGEALARLARGGPSLPVQRQILVVTHLPQVAAWADHQVTVEKSQEASSTVSLVRRLGDVERVTELARMLSGSPDSATARDHAAELLAAAATARAHG